MPDAMQQKPPQNGSKQSAPPHALALFRMMFGIILCASSLTALSSAAILTSAELLFTIGTLLFGFCVAIGAWLPYISIMLALIALLQWMLLTMADVNGNALTTQHQALLFAALLLALAGSGADRAYSYRMLRKYGTAFEWEDVRLFPIRLLQAVITAAYIFIGVFALWQSVWMSGIRLRSALIGPLGTALSARLARSDLPTALFSGSLYVTKAFTLMLPVCLWIRSARPAFLIIGVIFHILIVILIGKWWLLALAAGYPLFLNPDAVRLWIEQMSSKLFRKKAE